MADRPNVLPRAPRPTKKSYRAALKHIVLSLQAEHDLNDPELADRIGCSAPTIANVRRESTSLDGAILASIEYEFGPGAIDPFMALGRSRGVPIEAHCDTDHNTIATLLAAVQVIIETQAPDSDGGAITTPGEVRAHIFKLRAAWKALDRLIASAGPFGEESAA